MAVEGIEGTGVVGSIVVAGARTAFGLASEVLEEPVLSRPASGPSVDLSNFGCR